MLSNAAQRLNRREPIKDAIITVPANFDPAMRLATLKAAELAGINIKNKDGRERPVLLSEPNAVIYDFANQIHNGEIGDSTIDLSTGKKNIMVFDLGGGTLDVTFHEVERRSDLDGLIIDEIATNRYTLLGGNDFDRVLALAIFNRYASSYAEYNDASAKILREKKNIMPIFCSWAEQLKISLSNNKSADLGYESNSSWLDDDYQVTDSINITGYACDISFTAEEIENIFRPFMGEQLSFNDYKRIEDINDTMNIIYPVLDVLSKASAHYGGNIPKIDAVILNGGMSRFYMVINRLRDFFKLEPVRLLDPDLAVARGAAVFHCLLHRHEELAETMKSTGLVTSDLFNEAISVNMPKVKNQDTIYMSMKDDKRLEIIPAATDLPYKSPEMTGFRLQPDKNYFEIPIMTRDIHNNFNVIGKGVMHFSGEYPLGTFVKFSVSMNESRLITFSAWTCRSADGSNVMESGETDIVIGRFSKLQQPSRDLPSKRPIPVYREVVPVENEGADIDCHFVLNNIKQYCRDIERGKSGAALKIRPLIKSLYEAPNRDRFASVMLPMFNTDCEAFKLRLFVACRKIGVTWTKSDRFRLASACMNELESVIHYNSLYSGLLKGNKVNTIIQAIFTLSICGSNSDFDKLRRLHSDRRFRAALLYAYSKSKTNIDWIFDIVSNDLVKLYSGDRYSLQDSTRALANAFIVDSRTIRCSYSRDEAARMIIRAIYSPKINPFDVFGLSLALGCICDQRYEGNDVSISVVKEAVEALKSIEEEHPQSFCYPSRNIRAAVFKMLMGYMLSEEDETVLLEQLD